VPGAIVASRIVARAGGFAGLPKGGLTATVAATVGLSLLRKGRGWPGLALLGGTAGLVWLRRDRSREDTMIKAIFFDVDGTLVDSNEQHVTAWHDAFEERGLHVGRDAIREQIGKGGDLLVPALVPDADEDLREALSERHGALFKGEHLDGVEPFPAAAALVRRVHESGRKVVLASSADAKEVEHYIEQLGIKNALDAMTTIDDAETSKPAGDIFAAALAKVKPLTPDEVIVVGDTPYDVEAASKCGIRTVAVRSGRFSDDVLRDAGAIALYDDVAALLAGFDESPLSQ